MSIDLTAAEDLIRRGAWTEARALAEAALADDPRRAAAMRLLGRICEEEGRLDDADRHLAAATEADPGDAQAADDLIRISHRRGDMRRLGGALLARLRISPDFGSHWNDLGAVLERLGDMSQAATAYRRSITVEPTLTAALANAANLAFGRADFARAARYALGAAALGARSGYVIVGHALQRLGEAARAERAYRRSLVEAPDAVAAWEGLAALRRPAIEHDRILRFILRAVASGPPTPVTLGNLCEAHRANGRPDLAVRHGRRAIALAPHVAQAASALALACGDLDEDEMATRWSARALPLDPNNAQLVVNHGIALKAQGRLREAQKVIGVGLERNSSDANAHLAMATALLSSGQLREGLAEYEWRHAAGGTPYDMLPAPRWDGRRLDRGSLLVWGEQGLGDEVIFIQYLPLLRGRAPGLVVECDRRLLTILKRSFPDVEFVGRTAPPSPRLREPDICAQIALMSVPFALGFDMADFRSQGAYLVPDPSRVDSVGYALEPLDDRPRVGLAWRSKRKNTLSKRIHATLAEWEPILRVRDVAFVCVQYGDVDGEIAEAESRFEATITPVGGLDLFDDLEGVLALAPHLDLVIASGASAHCLLAAGGVETWQLLWRLDYFAFGEDTYPFWPRSRGFVREPGESWARPIAQVAAALEGWSSRFRRE